TAEQKAIQLKPDYAEAWYALGEALERLDRSPEAAAAYQKALDLKPNYFEAAVDLGSEYFKQKNWDKAIAAYEKAVKLKNDNVHYANLGWAYYNAAQRDMIDKKPADAKVKLEKARTDLQRATAATNSNYLTAPMVNLGMALNDLGDYADAIQVLSRVVERE